MTKQELLLEIKNKPFVSSLFKLTEKEIPRSDSIKEYQIGYYEFNLSVGIDKSINIQVLNEGTENEVAFYKDKVLEATL